MKRKYNGNESGHSQIYQFPCQIFPFRFRNILVSVNGIKFFGVNGYFRFRKSH